jgi:cation diffusion facilitator family transporter
MTTGRETYNYQKVITVIGIVLFSMKLVAWYITGSVAVLSDALEGTVNIITAFIGLYSLYLSAKPKDANHPYGHGKAEFVSAAIEGTLITVAGLIIVYEAIHHLRQPHPLGKLDTGIYLIGITAVINYIAGFIAVRKGTKNNSLALVASGKHLQSDTYTTAGIVIGLLLILFTKLNWLDSVVALVFAVVIIVTGYQIVRKSLAGIMDETDVDLMKEIVALLEAHREANWIDMHNLRIVKYGPTLHLDCHLTIPWYLNIREGHAEIDKLQALIQQNFGDRVEMMVHTDPCLEYSCSICTKTDCTVRQHTFEKRIVWTIENISSNRKHHLDSN